MKEWLKPSEIVRDRLIFSNRGSDSSYRNFLQELIDSGRLKTRVYATRTRNGRLEKYHLIHRDEIVRFNEEGIPQPEITEKRLYSE